MEACVHMLGFNMSRHIVLPIVRVFTQSTLEQTRTGLLNIFGEKPVQILHSRYKHWKRNVKTHQVMLGGDRELVLFKMLHIFALFVDVVLLSHVVIECSRVVERNHT